MKRFAPILISFLMFCFIATGIADTLSLELGISPIVTVASLIALIVITHSSRASLKGVVKADVNVEMWVDYFMHRLRKDNQFLNYFFSEDNRVIAGRIVHIPQPGAKPIVRKNRSSYPATAIMRTDTDIIYPLDEYTTDPTHIPNAQTLELSYDMQDSVLGDHMATLMEDIGDDVIIKILSLIPQANIVETTGASAAANVAGQTGLRKIAMPADLKKIKTRMNLANVPKTDRYAMYESNTLDQFTEALSEKESNTFKQYYNEEEGVIGRWEGFKILERSNTAMSASALNGSSQLVVNALGAANAATDQVTNLVWQKDCVAKALGEVVFFENLKDATYYGDVYSLLARMGARRRRANSDGVYAYRQATGS